MDKNIKLLIVGVGGLFVLSILLIGVSMIMTPTSLFGGTVAIIPVHGEIGYASDIFGGSVANPDTIRDLIEKAEEDPTISAILLDINSPGGTPVASTEIMEAVKNSSKPVVAWISDTGVSGAYLVASGADKIVASRSSWVGGIGVILTMTDLSDLYEALGIDIYPIKGGRFKDMGAGHRNLTGEEKQMLQNMINEEHDNFISIIAENRKLDINHVRNLAEGQMFTGAQAKEHRLIDKIGGRDRALDIAAELGGIGYPYETVIMTEPETFEDILGGLSSKLGYSIGRGIGSMIKNEIFYLPRF
ncbi:MAG: signal peptide peptidase SppA [Methanobacteriaceae archaeon]|jgi:protease-4